MKKLINDPADVVAEALLGHRGRPPRAAGRPREQGHLPRRRAAAGQGRADLRRRLRATSRCTAGSSGSGMLDAACAGEVFTSPVPDQMLAATKAVDGGAGVLHIVKNYTGDVMNFEMAAELAAAEQRRRGRRRWSPTTTSPCRTASTPPAGAGVGVTVLVEKIVGAAAEQGRSLAEVADLARKVNDAGRSMGMALTSCTVPGRRQADVRPARRRDGGRHRHPRRARPAPGAARTGRARSPRCWSSRSSATCDFTGGDGVLAFVNGMGGTPLIELYLMYNEVAALLDEGRGHRSPARWSATTSPAWTWPAARSRCSRLDDELLRLWDAPVNTPGLRWGV